jgi:predicted MFS family arabinose efflux permease
VNVDDSERLPPGFSRLAWSNLAAQSAEQIGLAAAPIVAVLMLGAGVASTGWLQTMQTLPFVLFAIPAGLLADRRSRRGVMTAAEALRALSLLGVLALVSSGALTMPLLAALSFVGAAGTVAYSVAAPALVPALVPAAALAIANARIELARTLAFAGGPALAGALVAWTGGATAFGVAAALSTGAVFLLAGLREPAHATGPGGDALQEIREGAGFVFGHRLLRPIFVTQFVFNAAFFTLQAVYVPYAVRHLGLSASGVGVTLGTYGVGMIVGALVAGRVMRALPFGQVIALGPVSALAGALVMLATIWIPSALLAALGFFLIGAGPIVWVISTATLRQTVTPRALLGRVSAINITAYGARPLGAALGAMVGGLYGAEACLVVAAAGFLVQAVVIVMSPAVQLVRQPEPVGDLSGQATARP